MEASSGFLFLFGIFGALALIPAFVAHRKGYTFGKWWLYALALWPVALIHTLLLPTTADATALKAQSSGLVACPHCAEWIKREAKVCRYCGRDVR